MLVQTQHTCWFYTILNGFLLSSNGQKILYKHLIDFESALRNSERAYFYNTNQNSCPGNNLTRMNKIYFWKFFDRYMCALGGPRSAVARAQKSANLLQRVSGITPRHLKKIMTRGAVGSFELPKVLRHMGVTNFSIDEPGKNSLGRATEEFVIYSTGAPPYDIERTIYRGRLRAPYDVAYAAIVIGNTSKEIFHSVCAYMVYNDGYIFDSNFEKTTYKVRWWKPMSLLKAVIAIGQKYPEFKDGQIDFVQVDYVVYTSRSFTRAIAPACRRPAFNRVKPTLNTLATRSAVNHAVGNMRNAGYVIRNDQVLNYLQQRFPRTTRKLF
jgi:hypothetical protein